MCFRLLGTIRWTQAQECRRLGLERRGLRDLDDRRGSPFWPQPTAIAATCPQRLQKSLETVHPTSPALCGAPDRSAVRRMGFFSLAVTPRSTAILAVASSSMGILPMTS